MDKKLIDDEALGPPYKKINLIEIEMELHRGYFDYIYESLEVFDLACKCAQEKFQELARCDSSQGACISA